MSSKELHLARQLYQYKESLPLYYTTQSLMGIDWWTYAWLVGARGRGKSFGAMETVLSFMKKYGEENVKCYYFRISDSSVQAMLQNKARKCIDPILVRKYNLDITTKASTVYNRGKPIIDFYALVSAAKKGKGVADYDPDFLNKRPAGVKRYIFVILDEFMIAENLEKKPVGNPVEQFKIYMENILRDQERLDYPAVRVFACANSVSECSDFLAQLAGFIPERPGRFKLKRKHMIVDNIPNSKLYLEKRKKSYNADIMDYENDSNYTNVIKRDLETLKPKSKRLNKPTAIIKFSKNPDNWFVIWDGNIIKKYNNQSCNLIIPMKRYLDSLFDEELVKNIIQRYDARSFLFNDLISQATFAANLKIIKAK